MSTTPASARSGQALMLVAALAAGGIGWWMVRAPRATAPDTATAKAAPAPEPRLGAQATMSSAVVQAMVSGNAAVARRTPSDLVQARAAFEQAVKLDERYAPAHASLAQVLVLLSDAGTERPSAVLPKAIEHGDLAVELDPAGAQGWHALARAEVLWTRDWSRAEAHFRRAIALDAKAEAAAVGLAQLLAGLGRGTEAMEQSRGALSIGAGSPSAQLSAGIVHYCAGEYREALNYFGQSRRVGASERDVAEWTARTQAAWGRLTEAAEAARQATAATGGASWVEGYVDALAGRPREAEEVLASMSAKAAHAYVPALEFAHVRAALGQREEALSLVETAVREHSPGSELLRVDPIFASLRSEPRFEAALAELKLGGRR